MMLRSEGYIGVSDDGVGFISKGVCGAEGGVDGGV